MDRLVVGVQVIRHSLAHQWWWNYLNILRGMKCNSDVWYLRDLVFDPLTCWTVLAFDPSSVKCPLWTKAAWHFHEHLVLSCTHTDGRGEHRRTRPQNLQGERVGDRGTPCQIVQLPTEKKSPVFSISDESELRGDCLRSQRLSPDLDSRAKHLKFWTNTSRSAGQPQPSGRRADADRFAGQLPSISTSNLRHRVSLLGP